MRHESEGGVVINGGSWRAVGKRRVGMALFALLAAIFASALLSDPAWAQPILEVEKTDSPDPVAEGEALTYTVEVSNVGTTDATNVVFADNLDPNTEFVSITTPTGTTCPLLPTAGTAGNANPDIFCNLGTLDNGETATITIQVEPTGQAATDGAVTNIATADSTETAPESDQETTTVTPDLEITKEDSADPVREGDRFSYNLRVENQGTAGATNVSVTDELPDGVSFVSATPSQGTCDDQPGNVVECDLNNLAGGATATIRILVEAQDAGTVSNTAEVFVQGVSTAIDEAEENTRIRGDGGGGNGNNGNGGNGNGGNGKGKGPNNGPNDDPFDFDGDGDIDQYDDFLSAEDDLDEDDEETNGEDTIGDDQYDDEGNDDDGDGVSANADDGQAEASTPGAVARAGGDPDELAPETSAPDDVVDEIPTTGELPNTGGTSFWAYALPAMGALVLAAALIRRRVGGG